MRIRECKIDAFGQIHDHELKDLDSSLVVVLGPNETGKSTLFEFLKTMIYGIYPTSPDQHRYVPWSGRRLEGSLSYRLEDGSLQTVFRRLSRLPEGHIFNGERRSIRNQTIPAAAHISRELFGSVYALTLAEMASIRDRPWQEIEERLLGEMSLDVLRPVKVVIGELEEEARTLWREDNRGKPKAKGLEKQIKDLRKMARSATSNDIESRRLQKELESIDNQLIILRERQVQVKSELSWLERVLPCRKLLARIEENRQLAGNQREIAAFPEAPENRIEELCHEILGLESKIAKYNTQVKKLRETSESFTTQDRSLLMVATEIKDWARKCSEYDHLAERLAEARAALLESQKRAHLASARILSTELETPTAEAVLSVSEEELTNAIKERSQAQLMLQQAQQNRDSFRAGNMFLPSVFLTVLGLVLSLVSLLRTSDILLASGISLFSLGAAWFTSVFLKRKQATTRLGTTCAELMRQVERSSERIQQLLAAIPLSERRLKEPDQFLVNDIQKLKTAAAEVRRAEGVVQNLEQQSKRTVDQLGPWLESLPLELPSPGLDAVRSLQVSLEEAEQRKLQAEHASSAEIDTQETIGQLSRNLQSKIRERDRLESGLRQLGDGDLNTGLKNLENRRSAFRTARSFQKNLEEDFPDWRHLRQESASLTSAALAKRVADCKVVLDETAEQIRNLSSARMSRIKDIQHLQSQRSLADLESEITQLQSDVRDMKFRRDRLMLLCRIIRLGNQRFRDKHQPDVLRKAGEYLSLVTSDRYNRLDFDQESESLVVFPGDQTWPIPVARPLSQGIRDQIYLSLRLAIVEHLDGAYERLPLFLDEILVNWDQQRRSEGYRLLRKVLSSRQVFVFTCHRWLAHELCGEIGGKQVELSPS